MDAIEDFVKIMPPWVFWPLWVAMFCIFCPMWVYGELGTFGYGFPYAPLAWFVSAIGALSIGISFGMRV